MSAGHLVVNPVRSSVRGRVLQKIFSFPAVLACLMTLLAVLTVGSRFDDPDMWWHLKMGEIIWTTHSIPSTDTFSYTTGHQAYVAHEWLSQLLIYGAYRFGNYSGLMLWLCILTSAILIGGYGLCWIYSGNAKVSFLGALIIWLFATVGLAVRPQMIGYLMLVAELYLIHLGRTRSPRWFLGLPLLFGVWVNCHGSFFLGLIVAAVFLFSSFFDFQKGSLVASSCDPHRSKMLGWALASSVAALLLNPNGVRQILYPLATMFHKPVGLSQVEEWQPLVITDGRGFALLGVLGCIFLVVLIRRKDLFWHELLLLTMGTWLAVSHRRMLFVFGILAAPVLSRMLSDAWEGYDAKRDHPALNGIFVSLSILAIVWAFPPRQSLWRQVEGQSPVKAVEFMTTNHISGRMLNEYVYGGYLIWAAPGYPVFVDGRADVFEETGVLTDFARWATLQSDPNDLLEKYGVDFCLLARNSPLASVLPLLQNWTAVYKDENSVIFTRVASASRSKIDRVPQ